MWDLYLSLKDILRSGELVVWQNYSGVRIRWTPKPGTIINHLMIQAIFDNVVSMDDLARTIAGILKDKLDGKKKMIFLPLKSQKIKGQAPMDHTTDAAAYSTKPPHKAKTLSELMDGFTPEQMDNLHKSMDEAIENPPPDDIFPGNIDPAAPCQCSCGGPGLPAPIPVDGKELVDAVIVGVEQWAPESRISYIMSMDPGYVFVFDEGIQWFTFHAPYFMQYVNRQSGKFELGDHGLDIVHSMVRQMQGIEIEGSLAAEASDGDQAAH